MDGTAIAKPDIFDLDLEFMIIRRQGNRLHNRVFRLTEAHEFCLIPAIEAGGQHHIGFRFGFFGAFLLHQHHGGNTGHADGPFRRSDHFRACLRAVYADIPLAGRQGYGLCSSVGIENGVDTARRFPFCFTAIDPEGNKLIGYSICDDKEVSGLLEANKELFAEILSEEGIKAGDVRFFAADAAHLQESLQRTVQSREEGKTPDTLYKAAKAYIGYIQEISKQKGNTEYENQL